MKVYDISQELFGSVVFPGDPVPAYEKICEMESGDAVNLSKISLCSHNGTHVDAPNHFIREGKTIDQMELERLVGMCSVIEFEGTLTKDTARRFIQGKQRRILWKGNVVFGEDAASVFVDEKILLVGVESQTVGPAEAPAEVHKILLGNEVAVVEGLRLGAVAEGDYLLSAAPVNLGGLEGAPCRAVLIEL